MFTSQNFDLCIINYLTANATVIIGSLNYENIYGDEVVITKMDDTYFLKNERDIPLAIIPSPETLHIDIPKRRENWVEERKSSSTSAIFLDLFDVYRSLGSSKQQKPRM